VIVYVRGPSGAGKSTLVEKLGATHPPTGSDVPVRDRAMLDVDGELVDRHTFGEPGESPRRPQLWRCGAALWIPGNYDGPERQKLGSKPWTADVSKGAGGDGFNGTLGQEMLRYYVALGLPHLVFESKRGSSEPRTEKSKDAPTPDWIEFLRQSGIVFARLDTPPEVLAANIDRRNEERDEEPSPKWQRITPAERVREKRYEANEVKNAAERLYKFGMPTVSLAWDENDPDAQFKQLHDLLMWGGYRCGHDRPLNIDWSERLPQGWTPPVPDPTYSFDLDSESAGQVSA
jgi:hypothetical protein